MCVHNRERKCEWVGGCFLRFEQEVMSMAREMGEMDEEYEVCVMTLVTVLEAAKVNNLLVCVCVCVSGFSVCVSGFSVCVRLQSASVCLIWDTITAFQS